MMPTGQPPAVGAVINGVMAAAAGGRVGFGGALRPRQQPASPPVGARMTGNDSDPDVDYSR
jgi:hypothetical protein